MKSIIIAGEERARPAKVVRKGDELWGLFSPAAEGDQYDSWLYWSEATPETLAALAAAGIEVEGLVRQRYRVYPTREAALADGWPDAEFGTWQRKPSEAKTEEGWIALDWRED